MKNMVLQPHKAPGLPLLHKYAPRHSLPQGKLILK